MIVETKTKGRSREGPGHDADVGNREVSQDRRAGCRWLACPGLLMMLSVVGVIAFGQMSNAAVPAAAFRTRQAITQ